MAKVIIIQSVMKHYRLPFFVQLHDSLARQGIELKVAYSDPNADHASRKDGAELPDDWGVKVKGHWFFNRLLYQSLWRQIARADLAIVGPEIKYLINPVLILMSALRMKKVAFWGLGPNLHPGRSRAAEWIKDRFFTRVDWWFAYTATVADYLKRKGMPAARITVVQNATDTTELRRQMRVIPDDEVAAAKIALTGSAESQIGFYCGMMQKIKSLPFLIETAKLVKQRCPSFHLVLIGSGPERDWLENAAANEPWIHYLGSKFGRDSALYYKMADVFLLGGTAGLAVVDSFAAGLPLLATQLPTHPPEISYIQDGKNGRLAPHDVKAFADAIVDTFSNPITMSRLCAGALDSAGRYTLETMVGNDADGIKTCLHTCGIASFSDLLERSPQTAER
jgi:glycosyltransferase involved in cell wall biosynthesis